jgi:GNAT superfamily N-acetyltransferase
MEIREITGTETERVFAAMRELHPRLTSRELFLEAVERTRADGYRIVASFSDGDDDAAAVAGFRLGESFAWGRYLYLEDLATRESRRRQGHAGALMTWLVSEARRTRCEQIHLDSRVVRYGSHRFYLNHGMRIGGYHFDRHL